MSAPEKDSSVSIRGGLVCVAVYTVELKVYTTEGIHCGCVHSRVGVYTVVVYTIVVGVRARCVKRWSYCGCSYIPKGRTLHW